MLQAKCGMHCCARMAQIFEFIPWDHDSLAIISWVMQCHILLYYLTGVLVVVWSGLEANYFVSAIFYQDRFCLDSGELV